MMEKVPGPRTLLHVVIGTPDPDDCPICQAHGQGEARPLIGESSVPIRVQELSLNEVLRCSCPLCVEARQETLKE